MAVGKEKGAEWRVEDHQVSEEKKRGDVPEAKVEAALAESDACMCAVGLVVEILIARSYIFRISPSFLA